MYRIIVLLCVALVFFAGCGQEAPKEEPKDEPPPPPEPTGDQIYMELKQAIEGFWRPLSGGVSLTFPEIDAGVANLRTVRASHAAHVNLADGLSKMKRDVEQLVQSSEDAKRWYSVIGGCSAYDVIEPGSTRFKKLEELARVMIARPQVRVDGFSTVDGQTYIMMSVTDRDTRQTNRHQVRVGEEFADVIRVEEIIGGQQKVRLNYLPVNDSDWIVLGPSERRKSGGTRGNAE